MIKNNLQIISSLKEDNIEKTDLAKIASKSETAVAIKAIRSDKVAQWKVLAFNKENTKSQLILGNDRRNLPLKTKKLLPKIVGDMKHYPPANKEWKNSIYAYNQNSVRSLPALDKMASKTIKSYFSLTNNKKLARS